MDYLDGYTRYLSEEKKASSNTLSSYVRDVGQFFHWLAGEGLAPEHAAQSDVEAYTRYLTAKGKSVATVTRSLPRSSPFTPTCWAPAGCRSTLPRGWPPPRWSASCPQILTSKEVELFWSSPTPRTPRAAGIGPCWSCSTPLESGCPSSSGLNTVHLNLSAGFIRCPAAGQGADYPPLSRGGGRPAGLCGPVRLQMVERPDAPPCLST